MPNFPLNISSTQAAVSPGLYHVCGWNILYTTQHMDVTLTSCLAGMNDAIVKHKRQEFTFSGQNQIDLNDQTSQTDSDE